MLRCIIAYWHFSGNFWKCCVHAMHDCCVIVVKCESNHKPIQTCPSKHGQTEVSSLSVVQWSPNSLMVVYIGALIPQCVCVCVYLLPTLHVPVTYCMLRNLLHKYFASYKNGYLSTFNSPVMFIFCHVLQQVVGIRPPTSHLPPLLTIVQLISRYCITIVLILHAHLCTLHTQLKVKPHSL